MHRKGLRGRFARVGLALAAVLTTVCAASVNAQVEKPKYGGSLSIGTNSPSLAPLSWDPADWNYKTAQDAGFYYDRLFIADFTKSKSQGGPYLFKSDSFLPSDAVRGDLAESWKWIDNPLRLEVKLRKGVMFPEKPGVMASRELTSQDVVYSYNRLLASPKRLADFIDLVDKFEAPDKYTVVIHFKYYHEDWGHRLGWGVFASVYPKEVVDAGIGDWKKANGSGPFMLTEYVGGNSQNYSKNPLYHGRETIGGQEYKLPFVDKVSIRIMKDEAARYAALRTAKLDLLQSITWTAAEELKKNVPQLKWARWLQHGSAYIAMRTDTKPFNDVRVRRALNMAINKQEIVSSFYGGNAEVFAYPQHPDYVGYFEPLSSMPDSIKELYTYSPDKAKKLLAEAGYPNGFTFKTHICACDPTMMDLGPLVAGYLQKSG
jgi:peptide/nickel transport system substrate-binding protein